MRMRVAGTLLTLLGLALAACGGDTARGGADSAPRSYFVSPAGDDGGPGTRERPWRTLDRVNRGRYRPGDRILLEGGQTFPGSLVLSPGNASTRAESPIVIGSYGRGRATIATAPAGTGLLVQDLGGIHVRGLAFVGASAASGGAGVLFANDSRRTLANLRLTDVEVSGHTHGVFVTVGDPPSRYRGIRLERVLAHDNAEGIALFGYLEARSGYGLWDVLIRSSRAYRNTGAGLSGGFGAGLFVLNADGLAVEDNVVFDNGGNNPEQIPNGPSGITIYVSRNVVVRGNEVYGQRYDVRNQTDNSGIDVWALGGVIEGNYVHDNEGWGLVLGSAAKRDAMAGASPSGGVTVRGNVVEGNGCRLPDSEATVPQVLAAVLMFGQLEDYELVGNTFSRACVAPADTDPRAVQGLVYLVDVPDTGGPWRDIAYRDNKLVAKGVPTLVEVPRPGAGSGLVFDGNSYEAEGDGPRVKWGTQSFADVRAWTAATGQEPALG